MQPIETEKQAIDWCKVHAASINCLDGIHVYLNGELLGSGETVMEAVNNADVALYDAEKRTIPRSRVEEALNRLNRYYAGREQSARRVILSTAEVDQCIALGVAANRWQTMRLAVEKVAQNLEVRLKPLDKQPEAQEDGE